LSAWLSVFNWHCAVASDVSESGSETTNPLTINVITSGGFANAYNLLEPVFEAETGVNLVTSYGSSSGGATDSIPVRLARGEQFDVVIMARTSLDKLNAGGYIISTTRIDLGESIIGMAVRSGMPKPDITTVEAFRRTLTESRSIGYSASASGTYLSTVLWPEMGLWKEIESKSTRILSERVASVVARGDLEIGFQQISEILPIDGAELVGPIPSSLQQVTLFSAAVTKRTRDRELAWMLIKYLVSKDVANTVNSTGLVPMSSEPVDPFL
jgi:molybdate transport system substrate-binding protein